MLTFRQSAISALFLSFCVCATGHAENDPRFYNGRDDDWYDGRGFFDSHGQQVRDASVQLGPRPFYLVQGMDEGNLKDRLKKCENGPFYRSRFSIGHRGAALQFPEHTKEAYQAGARMGAGIVECDVTFTADGNLVCRHDECDLHTTTNIVATPLNAKCSVPWVPAPWAPGYSPKCCASDLKLSEFKSLRGKMDASNPNATTAEGFLSGTPSWRTDLYTGRGTLMTLKESIALNQQLGVLHTPELKAGNPNRIKTIFGSQEKYAQRMIDELKAAGVRPQDVFAQSFNKDDILYWIQHEPEFGRQAVYLDSIDPTATPPIPRLTIDQLKQLKTQGVRIIAPPIFALLAVSDDGEILPSQYAKDIKSLGFDIITWTFERSDLRQGASKDGFYWIFDPAGKAVKKDSDMYKGWTRWRAKSASWAFSRTGPRLLRTTPIAWDLGDVVAHAVELDDVPGRSMPSSC